MGNMVKLKLIIALIALTLSGCDDIQVPKPDPLPAVKAPAPVSSTILIPVKISSASIHSRFESAIPLSSSGGEHGTIGDSVSIDYETRFKIDRGQLHLRLEGKEVALSTHLSGYGNVLVPTQGLIPRTSVTMDIAADIGVASSINVNPDWSISSATTSSLKVTKADTRILGFPVTAVDDVEQELRPKMRKLADDVTADLNALDLRAPVEKAWQQLGKPALMDKSKSGWLTIKPTGLYFSGFHNSAEGISAVIGVDAVIEGSYGPKPKTFNPGKLPPFKTISHASRGFQINLPLFASYSYLRESLYREVVGKSYDLDDDIKVVINDVGFYANGENVVLSLDIATKFPGDWFDTSGTLYFSGRPVFEGKTERLFLQDFDYDVQTKSYLAQVANELFHEELRSHIASKLSWGFSSKLRAAKERANNKLSHVPLKNGAILKGRLSTMKVSGVYPLGKGIQIGAVFKGDVSVEF